MTEYNAKTKRRVIPRWRSATVTASAHEFQPLRARVMPRLDDGHEVAQRLRELRELPSLGTAADALATAIMGHHTDAAREAAHYIQEHRDEAPRLLLTMADSTLGGDKVILPGEQALSDAQAVARLRSLLRLNPRSPALWVDLARHFASLGEAEKALRSMRTALGLAPHHRWVLRAANRLLLHIERPDEAHRLLLKNPGTRHDPWLISAELATAQILRRTPNFMRQATDILRHKTHGAAQISELATAVATTFLEDGNRKGARRLLRLALLDPTENALAQVEWADRESRDGLHVEHAVRSLSDAYEADCWVKYSAGRLTEALVAAQAWRGDEPFADRPAAMISHIAGLLDDYDTIIRMTDEALLRHPDDHQARNNQVFANLSQLDFVPNATEPELASILQFLIRRIHAKEGDLAQSVANLGLLYYRMGQLEHGQDCYEQATQALDKSGIPGAQILAASASLYHAREAVLARATWAPQVLETTRRLVKRAAMAALEFQMRKIEALAERPDQAKNILSPRSAERFLSSSARATGQTLRLTAQGGRPVVWVPEHLRRRS